MANRSRSTTAGPRCAVSELTVHSSLGDYAIKVALGAASDLGEARIALVDPAVADRVTFLAERTIAVEGSEDAKTLSACEGVLAAMKRAGLARGDVVVAVGGGVIQDVATLTTSLYMRGVDWVYVPTTLMAMADSCIGGKSSINAGGIKNLVGNFHPPQRILVDPTFITSLPQRAIASGLGEAAKICFARGRDSFEQFLSMDASLTPAADEATVDLLAHVLGAKKWFIEVDEFDKAERKLLNFGHSFGHAWESACGYRVQHGIAVAAGVLAAIRHPAAAQNPLTDRLWEYNLALLETVRDDVTAGLAATNWEVFRSSLRSDKKNGRTVLRLVLPAGDEGVAVRDLPLEDHQLTVAEAALREALEDTAA
jgi:3-dehydroquinate synthase